MNDISLQFESSIFLFHAHTQYGCRILQLLLHFGRVYY